MSFKASSGDGFVHETKSQVILNGSYNINFTMDLACKDLGFAMKFGRDFGVPLDLAALTEQTFIRAREAYGGGAWSSQVRQVARGRAEDRSARAGLSGGTLSGNFRLCQRAARRFRVAPRAWRATAQRRPGPSAHLQAFLQAFPNLGCFSPSLSKESFGGFVGFQRVTRMKNHKR